MSKPGAPATPPPVVSESDIGAEDEASAYQKKRKKGFNYDKTLLSTNEGSGTAPAAGEKKSLLG